MNYKNPVAQRFPAAAFLAVFIAITGFFSGRAQASPSEEISRAVAAAGAPSIKQAEPATFTQAFSSVVIRAKSKDVPTYITAAVKSRPDLAPQITVAALKARRPDKKNDDVRAWVDPIIRAAITAAPDATTAIVRAAIAAYPFAREFILAAAGQTETQTAFLRPSGVDAGNINSSAIGTINPANLRPDGNVNTPENP